MPGDTAPRERALLLESINRVLDRLPASDYEKSFVILTCLGLKPVSEITLDTESEAVKADPIGELKKAERELSTLGLYVVISEQHASLFVSFDASKAKRLSEIMYDTANEPANAEEKGTLMGFPRTAIDAYVRANNNPSEYDDDGFLGMNQIPEDIAERDCMAFFVFHFSKKHVYEEVEILEKWSQTVREANPELHARMVSNYHVRRKIDKK